MSDNQQSPPQLYEDSIINFVPTAFLQQLSGNIMMDEMQIWKSLNDQYLLEYNDRNQVSGLIRKSLKLFILSFSIGCIGNRGLSLLKYKSFEFFRIPFLLRFPIRFSIFMLSFYIFLINPMLNSTFQLRTYMNNKYMIRYKEYNEKCDPLIMNPLILNEPNMSNEDKEIRKLEVDKIRSQQLMIVLQSREIENQIRQSKKI